MYCPPVRWGRRDIEVRVPLGLTVHCGLGATATAHNAFIYLFCHPIFHPADRNVIRWRELSGTLDKKNNTELRPTITLCSYFIEIKLRLKDR